MEPVRFSTLREYTHGKGRATNKIGRPAIASDSFSVSCFRLTYFRSDALVNVLAPRWAPVDWVEMGSSSHRYFTRHWACGTRCVLSHSYRVSHCLSTRVTGEPGYGCPVNQCSCCGGAGGLVDATSIPKSLYSIRPQNEFGIACTPFSQSQIDLFQWKETTTETSTREFILVLI